jgi:RNA-directed DNA polymerase
MNYDGAFYKSALYCLLTRINAYLLRWVRNKYRRLRGCTKALKASIRVIQRNPRFSPTDLGQHAPTA